MRRSIAGLTIGLAWSLTILGSGCGTDPFGPPEKPKAEARSEPEAAKAVFLVSTIAPEIDPEGWSFSAMNEANKERLIFRGFFPGPQETPAIEPELVRRAITDGASALLVASSPAAGLPEALAEAESKKIPVVVIGRPITPPSGAKPFTTVTPKPFEAGADRLVAAVVQDLKKAKRTVEGTAVILADRAVDAFSNDRKEALKAAATRAGFQVRVVEFDGPADSESATQAVQSILNSTDDRIILSVDEAATTLASKARRTASSRPKLYAAGYVSYKNGLSPAFFSYESAVLEYRGEDMGRMAVRAAMARLEGGEPGLTIEFDPKFRRGEGVDPPGMPGIQPVEDVPPPRPPGFGPKPPGSVGK